MVLCHGAGCGQVQGSPAPHHQLPTTSSPWVHAPMDAREAAFTSCNVKLQDLQDQECYERGAIKHEVLDGDPSVPEPDQVDLAKWVYALYWPWIYLILCL